MVTPKRRPNGTYVLRKRLPDDVREAYARLYGARLEAKLTLPAGTKLSQVKQRFAEWLAEIEARIAALRAAAKGTGVALSTREARALAGEWYHWWIERRGKSSKRACEDRLSAVQEAIWACVDLDDTAPENPDDLWEDRPDVREAVRPVLADVGETAQFLAAKPIVLTNEARDLFLDYLYGDLAAALRRLIRLSEGDFSTDTYPERFPKVTQGTEGAITPSELFAKWVTEREPAAATVETWRYVFQAMALRFEERGAGSITSDEAEEWIKSLVTEKRSRSTVKTNWLNAANTVFGWGVSHKHLPRNPFAEVRLTVPRKQQMREPMFHAHEMRTILRAALSVADVVTQNDAARRWVPWLCAYTGARGGEITQLRGKDVFERDGIHALRITPDAGTVKNRKTREVPLHAHLIEQGFLEFVQRAGAGPLLFRERAQRADNRDPVRRAKPPASQARQRIAAWVRELGVSDKGLSPNHGWRHTFRQKAIRAGIDAGTIDNICGWAPASVGASYAPATLDDMAAALKKFPRYEAE